MSIKKNTTLGNIKISDEAVATLTGSAVIECYGVVGMTSQKPLKDGFNELLKRENYSKGVVIKNIRLSLVNISSLKSLISTLSISLIKISSYEYGFLSRLIIAIPPSHK